MRSRWVLAVGAWVVMAAPAAALPDVSARAAVLLDGATGQVLFARNPHLHLPEASTTKVTTAIVALEHGHLTDMIRASNLAVDTAGSSIYLTPGEKLTEEQLLYGMLLVSGNDAAIAIAQHVGGSLSGFVSLMNREAERLGLTDTHYANPDGLPAPDHYTSAYDLARIERYALTNPEFARIEGTRIIQLPGNARMPFRILVNHNRLLKDFPGAGGGKTGYTTIAGRCFVGSARRDGRYVVVALLDAPDLWGDARRLLDYGLDDFRTVTLAAPGSVLGQVPVIDGKASGVEAVAPQGLVLSQLRGDGEPIHTAYTLDSPLQAPVMAGQTVGHAALYDGSRLALTVPLVAARAVSFVPLPLRILWSLLTWTLRIAIAALFAALLLGITRQRHRWRRRHGLAASSRSG